MTYRIYLRYPDQTVSDKTVTGDPEVAKAAFAALVVRTDLDGSEALAVCNRDGKPVARHAFALGPDGLPSHPDKWWRGQVDHLDFSAGA